MEVAKWIELVFASGPSDRVAVATHSKKLVSQSPAELLEVVQRGTGAVRHDGRLALPVRLRARAAVQIALKLLPWSAGSV